MKSVWIGIVAAIIVAAGFAHDKNGTGAAASDESIVWSGRGVNWEYRVELRRYTIRINVTAYPYNDSSDAIVVRTASFPPLQSASTG